MRIACLVFLVVIVGLGGWSIAQEKPRGCSGGGSAGGAAVCDF